MDDQPTSGMKITIKQLKSNLKSDFYLQSQKNRVSFRKCHILIKFSIFWKIIVIRMNHLNNTQ